MSAGCFRGNVGEKFNAKGGDVSNALELDEDEADAEERLAEAAAGEPSNLFRVASFAPRRRKVIKILW